MLGPEGDVRFPWMDGTTYPLEVWFYTVRAALCEMDAVVARQQLFQTPITLRRSHPKPVQRAGRTRAAGITLRVGAGRNQGRRGYMEDVDFAHPTVSCGRRSVGLYGVLDGHGGADCAAFVADELPSVLAACLRRHGGKSGTQGVDAPGDGEVLYQAFLDVDADYLSSTHSNAGSTANVLCWDKETGIGFLANSGDTRTVVCGADGRARDVTRDRKATTPEEVARVATAGGFVANGRVMGSLAVARAFGDKALKIPLSAQGVPPCMVGDTSLKPRTAVTPAPELTMFCPRATDQFMVLATDGLWDVFSSQEAVDVVTGKATAMGKCYPPYFLILTPTPNLTLTLTLTLTPNQPLLHLGLLGEGSEDLLLNEAACKSELSRLADDVAALAVKKGSMDNVTVMVVMFDRCEQDAALRDLGDEPVEELKEGSMCAGLDDTFDESAGTEPDEQMSAAPLLSGVRGQPMGTGVTGGSDQQRKQQQSRAGAAVFGSPASPGALEKELGELLGTGTAASNPFASKAPLKVFPAPMGTQPRDVSNRFVTSSGLSNAGPAGGGTDEWSGVGSKENRIATATATAAQGTRDEDEDMMEFLMDDSNF